MTDCLIGVDVGTQSARAGVFDINGLLLGSAKRDLTLYREGAHIVEQSSLEIWDAVCTVVRSAMTEAGVGAANVMGIGFDATCSLVVVGQRGEPIAVGPSGDTNRDIIVWMDHRAIDEADFINESGHDVLKFVGGRISPEMQTPKLRWLKENLPSSFAKAKHFFDLADFLTWKATGDLTRSVCTVTCKWTYLAHEQRWDPSFFEEVGLEEFVSEDFARVGKKVLPAGEPLGAGLTIEAAQKMGLAAGTPVSVGLIDAHAGGLGTVGATATPEVNLAYVFGTSSCTMTSVADPVFVPGVWGPYYSAMVPDIWLLEGGQSLAGGAIDYLLRFHPAHDEVAAVASEAGLPVPVLLADMALERASSPSDVIALAGQLQVVPEFLGNRSPLADPHPNGIIAGLGTDSGIESMISLYVAGLASIGYGLRQIIETQAQHGAPIEQIVVSGGAAAHPLVRQLLADAAAVPVLTSRSEEPVLLGAAILGSVAGGVYDSIASAMAAMSGIDSTYVPSEGMQRTLHDVRFEAFKQLQAIGSAIRLAPQS